MKKSLLTWWSQIYFLLCSVVTSKMPNDIFSRPRRALASAEAIWLCFPQLTKNSLQREFFVRWSQVKCLATFSRDPASRFLPFAKPQTKTSLRLPPKRKISRRGDVFVFGGPTGNRTRTSSMPWTRSTAEL